MREYSAQVLIVGGGATGVGILRDLSMRGISAILFEQGDLAQGTSSRFHGLLHSGARYAVKDPVSAAECSVENKILKRIALGCIRPTGGWFVQMAEDDPAYTKAWLEGCRAADIPIRELDVKEAYAMEPLLRKQAKRVFEVPDAAVDGFKLVWANAKSAQSYGGRHCTYHKVDRLLREEDRVIGLTGQNMVTGQQFSAQGTIVVNATGAWAGELAATAGIELEVICDKGTLLAFNQRLFQRVINHLRSPADGDIFVPHENITIFGTTSGIVDNPRANQPQEEEVRSLLDLGAGLMPLIADQRIIRAFAGVRPLYQDRQELAGSEDEGRAVSRNFVLLDHQEQDGIQGLISIVGGKLTTYRLMAEKVADKVAAELGVLVPCRTAEESLWPEASTQLLTKTLNTLSCTVAEKLLERWGAEAESLLAEIEQDPSQGQLLCECEMVTLAEVKRVIALEDTHHLADVRRKTRLGMGTCQGAYCTYRALPLLWNESKKYAPLGEELRLFLNQRWKGIRPVLWGQQLRETELTRAIYNCTLNLTVPAKK